MRSRVFTIVLLIGLGGSLSGLIPKVTSYRLPGNNRGYEPAQPIAFSHRLHAGELQIACLYCHSGAEKSRHAGIPAASLCMNCHRFVTAPFGSIRAEDQLAKKEKREPRRIVSPEIQKLYDALAPGRAGVSPAVSGVSGSGKRGELARMMPTEQPAERPPYSARALTPIVWTKVHSVPDFVYFDHRPHINAGVTCQQCHGPVETMERVRQVEDLTMGWCVNCHRDVNKNGLAGKRVYASIDCSTCHY